MLCVGLCVCVFELVWKSERVGESKKALAFQKKSKRKTTRARERESSGFCLCDSDSAGKMKGAKERERYIVSE